MKNDNRNRKPYILTDAATGSYAAKWGKDACAVGAPQRHNWIIRRDPLIVVSGDRPAWGLLVAEREPRVDPPFFVYATVRAGVEVDGVASWLDEHDELEVRYSPWCSEQRILMPGGLLVSCACTAWGNGGSVLRFATAGAVPADAVWLVEIDGIGMAPQSTSSSFILREAIQWLPCRSRTHAGGGVIRYAENGRALHAAMPGGRWQADGRRLVCRIPLMAGDLHDLALTIDGSAAGMPGFDAAEARTRAHYEEVLKGCRSRTPDKTLDAALAGAVVTLDQVRDGRAWLEGITRWNTRWAINYQVGAAVAMGRLDAAREALLDLAAVERGPGQVLFADGTSTTDDWGWADDALPYYALQWHRYNEAAGDDLQARLAGPVGRSFERFMANRDYARNGLAGWHLGCNSFLYQADHLSLPGPALSPSIMVALMRRILALAADAGGDESAARRQCYAADLVERELMRRFWNPARGAFVSCLDNLGMAHERGYYTDFVFPALYSRLSPYVTWCALEAADRCLWTDDGFFRSGNLLPAGFGNSMVGVVQSCEAAEAYASVGHSDRCYALLSRMALAMTTCTDCPGSAPESCEDDGFGRHAYAFGNPAGAFILGVIQGLFGLYRTERGECLLWRPALPDDWEEGELVLNDLRVAFRGTSSGRRYSCEHRHPRRLRLRLFCPSNDEMVFSDGEGREIKPLLTAHPAGQICEIELGAAAAHQVIVKRQGRSGRLCPPASVESRQVSLELPRGAWAIEDPCALFERFRVDGRRLSGTLAARPSAGRFWLVETAGRRAFAIECPATQPDVSERSEAEPLLDNGDFMPVDVDTWCNATTVPTFGKYSRPVPVRAEGDDRGVEGFRLPPAAKGAVVLEVGENDWETGRLLLPHFPHRLTIPLEGCADGLSILAAIEGRVRLTGMIVARLCATYADGRQAVRDIAFHEAPRESGAASLPCLAGPVIAGRKAGVIDLMLDPDRPLREMAVEVLTADARMFVYACRVRRPQSLSCRLDDPAANHTEIHPSKRSNGRSTTCA